MLEKRSSCKALTCNCSFIVGNARKRRKFLRTSSSNSSNERGSIYIVVGPAPRNIPLPGVLLPGVLRMPEEHPYIFFTTALCDPASVKAVAFPPPPPSTKKMKERIMPDESSKLFFYAWLSHLVECI
jgi:hypothetical protein